MAEDFASGPAVLEQSRHGWSTHANSIQMVGYTPADRKLQRVHSTYGQPPPAPLRPLVQRANTTHMPSPYFVGATRPLSNPPVAQRRGSYGGAEFRADLKDYDVIGPIAQGAFSQVLRGKKREDDQAEIAIKCFSHKKVNASPEEKKGMQRELGALRALEHTHVMRLYQCIEGANYTYAIMEYCGGGSLRLVLRQRSRPLDEAVAAPLVRQIAEALAHCHEAGIIHRDVKAANVLFADPSRTSVKLVDFGFAAPCEEAQSASAANKCGTPSHMAPELYTKGAYDGRAADVFALGVLAFEMLHLMLPFDAPTLEGLKLRIMKGHRRKASAALSPAARNLVCSMLAVSPTDRPVAEHIPHHSWCRDGALSDKAEGSAQAEKRSREQAHAVSAVRRASAGDARA